MKKLALVLVVLSGCALYFGDDSPPPSPQQMSEAERLWINKAYPAMQQACTACHGAQDPSIAFLAGNDPWQVRDTLLASEFVSLDHPETSRLLTKGPHAGPGMTALQTSDILEWLTAERDGR